MPLQSEKKAPVVELASRPSGEWKAPKLLSVAPSLPELRTLYHTHLNRILQGGTARQEPLQDVVLEPAVFEELIALLEEAHPSLWRQRTAATWILGQAALTEGQRLRVGKALCDSLYVRSQSTSNRWKERLWGALRFSFPLFAVGAILGYLCRLFVPLPLGKTLWYNITLFSIGAFPCFMLFFYSRERSKAFMVGRSALSVLEKLALPESVNLLTRLAFQKDLFPGVARALTHALPRLTPKHYGRLEPTLVENLCELLMHCSPWHPELMFLILEALEKVGDSRAIRPLQKLLLPHILENFPSPKRLQQAVDNALAILRERAKAEEAQETLLRAAEEDEDSLLRPSQERNAPQDNLLRATDTPIPRRRKK
jgi:hypothetical protein